MRNAWKVGMRYVSPEFMLEEGIAYAYGDSMPDYLDHGNIASVKPGDIIIMAKSVQDGIKHIGLVQSKPMFCLNEEIKEKDYLEKGIARSEDKKLIEKFSNLEYHQDVVYFKVDWLDIDTSELDVNFVNTKGFVSVKDNELLNITVDKYLNNCCSEINAWKVGMRYVIPEFMLNEGIAYVYGDSMPDYLNHSNIASVKPGDIIIMAKSVQDGIKHIGLVQTKPKFCLDNSDELDEGDYLAKGIERSKDETLIEKFSNLEDHQDIVYFKVNWLKMDTSELDVKFVNTKGFVSVKDNELLKETVEEYLNKK